jgi:hypothetical protein
MMPKFYVYPLSGKPKHAVIVADDEWTMGISLSHRFEPPDAARYQAYQLAYGPQPLWRVASELEEKIILELAPSPEREQLYGVSGS